MGDAHCKSKFVSGDYQLALSLGCNEGRELRQWYTNVDGLVATLSTHRIGEKSGPYTTQGITARASPDCRPVSRKGRNVVENCTVFKDSDDGTGDDELHAACAARGLFHIIQPTASHLKTQSAIGAFEEIDPATDPIGAVEYIREVEGAKGTRPYILDSIHDVERVGSNWTFRHVPWPKFRLILILTTPWTFWPDGGAYLFRNWWFDDGESIAGGWNRDPALEAWNLEQRNAWKGHHRGLDPWLGIHSDRVTCDPARLFYLPARPPGSNPADYVTKVYPGEFLDLASVPRVDDGRAAASRPRRGAVVRGPITTARADDVGDDGSALLDDLDIQTPRRDWTPKTPNLRRVLRDMGDRFLITQFVEAHADKLDIRKREGGKITCKCPFDHKHSNPNDPADSGFYVQNAAGARSWIAFCSHGTSPEHRQPDRWQFVDELCAKVGVRDARYLLKFCAE